jgi:ABC-type uncharacterized transport system substrate-binding protein
MLRVVLRFALVIIAASVSSAPHAQERVWRIGFLDMDPSPTPAVPSHHLRHFQRGLDELGYEEGRNYVIDARFADTDRSRLPALAKELVDRDVDVIVTIGNAPVSAAKAATGTIPIIMAGSTAPVENGLVSSLARPGGNVTGVTTTAGPAIAGKSLQLFRDAAPNISRVAILGATGAVAPREDFQYLNLILLHHDLTNVRSVDDFESILLTITQERADAVFVSDAFVNTKYYLVLIDFLLTNKLPSMFQDDYLVERGGLLSYHTQWPELRRRAASYVDRILKGAKPEDLPVEQPSRFELVVNLKTAKMLGLTIPPSILTVADKVIE